MTPMTMPLVGMLHCSMVEVERESEVNGINIFDSVILSGFIPDPS